MIDTFGGDITQYIEFEVQGELPPKYLGNGSIWNDDTETIRLIKLRQEAYKQFKDSKPYMMDIKLEIEIWTLKLEEHTKPWDLDNFIKGVCDSLFYEKSKLENDEFELHDLFELPENGDIHPKDFPIIDNDEYIVEIWARMNFIGKEEKPRYRIRVEGD